MPVANGNLVVTGFFSSTGPRIFRTNPWISWPDKKDAGPSVHRAPSLLSISNSPSPVPSSSSTTTTTTTIPPAHPPWTISGASFTDCWLPLVISPVLCTRPAGHPGGGGGAAGSWILLPVFGRPEKKSPVWHNWARQDVFVAVCCLLCEMAGYWGRRRPRELLRQEAPDLQNSLILHNLQSAKFTTPFSSPYCPHDKASFLWCQAYLVMGWGFWGQDKQCYIPGGGVRDPGVCCLSASGESFTVWVGEMQFAVGWKVGAVRWRG